MLTYSLEEVLGALKEADRAGNADDARQLAQMADRMITAQETPTPEEPKPSPSYITRGIATSLGAPVDLFGAIGKAVGLPIPEDPVGGRESISRAFRAMGVDVPEKPPEGIGEQVEAGIGETAGMLIPGMAVAKLLTRGVGLTAKIAEQIYKMAVRRPVLTGASEITSGAGMGIGRQVSKEHPEYGVYPEMGGGIVGGMTPQALAFTPTALAMKGAKWGLGKISTPFTEAGAKYRASDFLRKQVIDPEAAAEALKRGTIGELPPVATVGEKRLMALYNHIRDLDPITDAKTIERISNSALKLQQEMRGLGRGSPEILRAITEKRLASIELGMDTRIARSMEVAQQKIDALPIAQRQSQESIIVRNELTKIMNQERDLVQEAWRAVPRQASVDVENTKTTIANIYNDLPIAQKRDFPAVVRTHPLFKKAIDPESKLEVLTNINEMQGLRSKLLEVVRQARANSQWNKARIADEIGDSILADLTVSASGARTPEAQALRTALFATRQFKQRFEQGTVAKVLGYERTSAPSIAPEITLDIATRGKGVVDIDKVVVTPEARMATERYIARSFSDYSLDPRTGTVNATKAQKFIRNNEELLDSFPELRAKLTDIGQAQEMATKTKAVMEARKAALRDPKVSAAAKFLGAEVGDEINRVIKSPRPALTMQQLVRQARKDQTGQALEGLRSGFIEHILDNSAIGKYNDFGERTLSGKTMLGFINDNRDVLNSVFPRGQLARMSRIGQELAKLENLEKTKGMAVEYTDAVSSLLKFASRFAGAAVGRHWGRAVGAGGTVQIPGFFASHWHNITSKLTKNRFEKLVHDAIVSPDSKLLEALLMPINKPTWQGGRDREVGKRLHAWLMATGNRVMQDILAEEEEIE